MNKTSRTPLHPLAVYAMVHSLDQRRSARFFDIPYGVYRQIVTGHTSTGFARMEKWEKLSRGEVTALSAWGWQKLHRKDGKEAA